MERGAHFVSTDKNYLIVTIMNNENNVLRKFFDYNDLIILRGSILNLRHTILHTLIYNLTQDSESLFTSWCNVCM